MAATSGDEGLRVRESSYTARSICSPKVSFFGVRLGDRLLIKYSWLQPIARRERSLGADRWRAVAIFCWRGSGEQGPHQAENPDLGRQH